MGVANAKVGGVHVRMSDHHGRGVAGSSPTRCPLVGNLERFVHAIVQFVYSTFSYIWQNHAANQAATCMYSTALQSVWNL